MEKGQQARRWWLGDGVAITHYYNAFNAYLPHTEIAVYISYAAW